MRIDFKEKSSSGLPSSQKVQFASRSHGFRKQDSSAKADPKMASKTPRPRIERCELQEDIFKTAAAADGIIINRPSTD